jgi:hypothetical protein
MVLETVIVRMNFEAKLAENIKQDTKSFCAHVRSKSNVSKKIRPLLSYKGDAVSESREMAEQLNNFLSQCLSKRVKIIYLCRHK